MVQHRHPDSDDSEVVPAFPQRQTWRAGWGRCLQAAQKWAGQSVEDKGCLFLTGLISQRQQKCCLIRENGKQLMVSVLFTFSTWNQNVFASFSDSLDTLGGPLNLAEGEQAG